MEFRIRGRLLCWLLPLALLLALGVGVPLGASSTGFTVKTGKNSAIGSIVVSSTGMTLYHFSSETKGSIKCTGACVKAWPPLTIGGGAKPNGGPGITASKLGTIKRSDGKIQVTYNGLALYRYSQDARAGDVSGQGSSKVWYAVTPAGAVTKVAVASAAKTSGSTPAGSQSTGAAAGAGAADPRDCTAVVGMFAPDDPCAKA